MGITASDCTIVVDTDAIIAQAEQVTASISRMEHSFQELQRMVKQTKTYWQGKAGDCHRNMFQENQEDISRILKRLKEHPKDLTQIAGGYTKTEKDLTGKTLQLRNDYI